MEAEPTVWEYHIERNPIVKQFRFVDLDHYDILSKVFKGNIATGTLEKNVTQYAQQPTVTLSRGAIENSGGHKGSMSGQKRGKDEKETTTIVFTKWSSYLDEKMSISRFANFEGISSVPSMEKCIEILNAMNVQDKKLYCHGLVAFERSTFRLCWVSIFDDIRNELFIQEIEDAQL